MRAYADPEDDVASVDDIQRTDRVYRLQLLVRAGSGPHPFALLDAVTAVDRHPDVPARILVSPGQLWNLNFIPLEFPCRVLGLGVSHPPLPGTVRIRSEEHTSELQSRPHL